MISISSWVCLNRLEIKSVPGVVPLAIVAGNGRAGGQAVKNFQIAGKFCGKAILCFPAANSSRANRASARVKLLDLVNKAILLAKRENFWDRDFVYQTLQQICFTLQSLQGVFPGANPQDIFTINQEDLIDLSAAQSADPFPDF